MIEDCLSDSINRENQKLDRSEITLTRENDK